MTTVAFIGLGIMGAPMAGHLVDAGFDVIGYNRSPAKVDALVERGGRAAASVADAVRDADVVAVMVPDSPDVTEVLAGDGGVFEAAKPGTLIIDFSSDPARRDHGPGRPGQGPRPAHPRRPGVRWRGRRHRRHAVDHGRRRPGRLRGRRPGVPGGREDRRARGAVRRGQTVKAANQLIVAGNIQLLAEAVAFLEAYGVDTEAALTVLGGGLAGSKVLDQKGANMRTRSFPPGFRIELHHKDLGIVTAAAREAGVVIPLGAVVAQLMASARANGDGGLDHSALLRGVLRLSGQDPDAA